MKKATLIATCLVGSGICSRLEAGEEVVRRVFAREFPGNSFDAWNLELPAAEAQRIAEAVSGAMLIDVALFVRDLSD